MRKRLLCAVAIAGLVVSITFPHIPVLAENGDEKPVITYELGDSRVTTTDDTDSIVHDLNVSEDYEVDIQSMSDAYERPVIVYELGDSRVPTIEHDCVGNLHILEEPVTKGDYAPTKYHNLAVSNYDFSFTNVRNYVYTNAYFSTDKDGYISVSTSGINRSLRISMIELDTGTVVKTWEGDPSDQSGVGFPGDSSKFYYFKFEPYNEISISGSGEVYWF